ncbi:hypothetical protein Dimus_025077 [Dionaea muscipula]
MQEKINTIRPPIPAPTPTAADVARDNPVCGSGDETSADVLVPFDKEAFAGGELFGSGGAEGAVLLVELEAVGESSVAIVQIRPEVRHRDTPPTRSNVPLPIGARRARFRFYLRQSTLPWSKFSRVSLFLFGSRRAVVNLWFPSWINFRQPQTPRSCMRPTSSSSPKAWFLHGYEVECLGEKEIQGRERR